MPLSTRTALLFVFSAFFGVVANPSTGHAYDEENRTANRSVLGHIIYPGWLFNKPEHAEFLPLTSNSDPQHRHPAAWDGQDWDSSQWNSAWTANATLEKFFHGRIFERQYMRGNIPALEVGPTFFKLSELDQRRTLKLLTDEEAVFQHGYDFVELVDWYTHNNIGTYTPKGLFLN